MRNHQGWRAVLLMAAMGAVVGVADLSAQSTELLDSPVKTLPTGAVAGDVIAAGPHLGAAPLGATIDDSDTLYVVDLFSGNTYLYDLALNNLGSMLSPTGTNTTTGLAFADGSLYWVDAGDGILVQSDLMGAIIEVNPMTSPGAGLLGGMDYDDVTGTLWADDIVSDGYYEFSLDGIPSGADFPNPAGTPGFGNGITHVDGSNLFDIPAGTIGAGQVDTLFRMESSNVIVDQVPTTNVPDTFINGLAYHPSGSAGVPVVYFVGNATNMIYETETFEDPNPNPGGPEFIRGDVNGDGSLAAIVDGVFILNFGFLPGSPAPPCMAAADCNGDLTVSALVDGVFILNFGFVPGSPPPPLPFPDCGEHQETVDALGCDMNACDP